MIIKSLIEVRVESLLAEYPVLRNNDRRLIRRYLSRHHNIKTFDEYVDDKKAPALETITRCRRKLQELGYYPAYMPVTKERAVEEEKHKNHFRRS